MPFKEVGKEKNVTAGEREAVSKSCSSDSIDNEDRDFGEEAH